jgi:hypothetical protein
MIVAPSRFVSEEILPSKQFTAESGGALKDAKSNRKRRIVVSRAIVCCKSGYAPGPMN